LTRVGVAVISNSIPPHKQLPLTLAMVESVRSRWPKRHVSLGAAAHRFARAPVLR
jgi:hypothetical protein